MPFLENVARGRGIPRERLETVAAHYMRFAGRSPINDESRKLVAALTEELARRGPALPVYWGNRNWTPLLADTVRRMQRDGIRRAVAIATSAFSSYSACRQYLEDIARARAEVGDDAPIIEKIPPYWSHPSFLKTMIGHTHEALAELERSAGAPTRSPVRSTRLVFTAHSIPVAMAESCDYADELREASSIVAAGAAPGMAWDLAWQSRSGPPSVPWLEPDILDHLHALARGGTSEVVVVPIGFVADHMEVVFDLDVQAKELAGSLGMGFVRARCAGASPTFVAGLRDLVADRVADRVPETMSARTWRTPCTQGCCTDTPRR